MSKRSQYTCHTFCGGPVVRKHKRTVQDGWTDIYVNTSANVDGGMMIRVPVMREIETSWKPIECGHITSHLDEQCKGCAYRAK